MIGGYLVFKILLSRKSPRTDNRIFGLVNTKMDKYIGNHNANSKDDEH